MQERKIETLNIQFKFDRIIVNNTDCEVKQLHNVAHEEELLELLAIGQPIQVLVSAALIIQTEYFALELFRRIYTLLSVRNGRAHVDRTIKYDKKI